MGGEEEEEETEVESCGDVCKVTSVLVGALTFMFLPLAVLLMWLGPKTAHSRGRPAKRGKGGGETLLRRRSACLLPTLCHKHALPTPSPHMPPSPRPPPPSPPSPPSPPFSPPLPRDERLARAVATVVVDEEDVLNSTARLRALRGRGVPLPSPERVRSVMELSLIHI